MFILRVSMSSSIDSGLTFVGSENRQASIHHRPTTTEISGEEGRGAALRLTCFSALQGKKIKLKKKKRNASKQAFTSSSSCQGRCCGKGPSPFLFLPLAQRCKPPSPPPRNGDAQGPIPLRLLLLLLLLLRFSRWLLHKLQVPSSQGCRCRARADAEGRCCNPQFQGEVPQLGYFPIATPNRFPLWLASSPPHAAIPSDGPSHNTASHKMVSVYCKRSPLRRQSSPSLARGRFAHTPPLSTISAGRGGKTGCDAKTPAPRAANGKGGGVSRRGGTAELAPLRQARRLL